MPRVPKPVPEPSAECRELVLKLIAQSNEPQTVKQINAGLTGPFKLSDKVLKTLLDGFVSSGQLQVFAPLKGKADRYWDRSIDVLVPGIVLAKLELKGPVKLADLKKLVLKEVKGLPDTQFQSVIEAHREAGRVFEHPPLTATSKVTKWATFPPVPSEYLKAIGKDFSKVLSKYTKLAAALSASGVSEKSLNDAARRMLESAGMPPELLAAEKPVSSSVTTTTATDAPSKVDLVALMSLVEPRARSGALVTVPELRRAASLSKSAFDQEVLRLARSGAVVLHRHDFPAGLTESERADLVNDESCAFYIGIGIRQSVANPSE